MMMKRAVSSVLFGLGVAILGGCPIYSSDRDHRVCIGGDCYDCPDSSYSASCHDWTCTTGLDCPSGYSCNTAQRCKLTDAVPPGSTDGACTKPSDCATGNCGKDNRCHTGDCSATGCPSSFVCLLEGGTGGVPKCVAGGGNTGGTTSSCKSDKDCPSPAGSKCLTGTCVAPQDQCADATQCAAVAQCVQGACTPSCSASKPCPTGYGCDAAKGVCTENPTPCTSSAQCNGGKVCVQEHCTDACDPTGACKEGLKCVDGGCTPDQKPIFTCSADGAQDNCQPGSICLRHSCYIACSADAGTETCKSADQFNQCKAVTTSSGTHNVCGSTANLGTDCDPTQAKNCMGSLICIDGYCK
jgi:hypothetical protein